MIRWDPALSYDEALKQAIDNLLIDKASAIADFDKALDKLNNLPKPLYNLGDKVLFRELEFSSMNREGVIKGVSFEGLPNCSCKYLIEYGASYQKGGIPEDWIKTRIMESDNGI